MFACADALWGGRRHYFPPVLDDLLAWTTLFRCSGTVSNYLAYVRTACLVVKAPVEVFGHPALARAKASVSKSGNFSKRPRLWIQGRVRRLLYCLGLPSVFVDRALVERILGWCEARPEYASFGTLYLLSYVFLLRLPSEALPVRVGKLGLHLDGDKLVLLLATRCSLGTRWLGRRVIRVP